MAYTIDMESGAQTSTISERHESNNKSLKKSSKSKSKGKK